MDKDDIYFMQEALKEARKAFALNEVPVGAVIVCEGKIIARAHNLSERLTDATAHAEMQAFTSASSHLGGKYLNECTLYVTIEPCPMCAGAGFWTQLGKIVYGAKDEKRGYSVHQPSLIHPKTKIISGILEEECRKLMTEFFRKKRPSNSPKGE
ncbi:MAG: nucleoside deaminase [Bacteroidetes bacterium]|nr:MAG: nucleoside deaminase [Bacteroidota bacterium]